MIRGSAVHKAIEEDNKHYIDTRDRLGFNELKIIAEEEFERKLLKEGVFIPKSKEKDQEKIIDKAHNEVIAAVRLYSEMEKDWEPVGVEENYTINIGYPLPIVCYMDMVDTENCIWDWKTTAKNSQVYEGLQNWIYSKVYEEKWGVRPTFKYCNFVLKKNPHVEIQTLEPVKDYSLLDRYIEAYIMGIEADIYLPASKFDFMCSEGGCPFYLTCEFKKGKKDE